MKSERAHRLSSIALFVAPLVLVALTGCAASTAESDEDTHADTAASSEALTAYTHGPGTAERKAILDALRADQKALTKLDEIYVVHHLKVQSGWAFTQVSPQSPDGKNHYEDLSALLHKTRVQGKYVWSVAGYVAAEADTDFATALTDLQSKFSGAPKSIFP